MYSVLILIIFVLLCCISFLVYFIFKERVKYTEQLLNELKEHKKIIDNYNLVLKELINTKKDETV